MAVGVVSSRRDDGGAVGARGFTIGAERPRAVAFVTHPARQDFGRAAARLAVFGRRWQQVAVLGASKEERERHGLGRLHGTRVNHRGNLGGFFLASDEGETQQ